MYFKVNELRILVLIIILNYNFYFLVIIVDFLIFFKVIFGF